MEADQTTKSYFVIYVNQKSMVVQVLLALKEGFLKECHL